MKRESFFHSNIAIISGVLITLMVAVMRAPIAMEIWSVFTVLALIMLYFFQNPVVRQHMTGNDPIKMDVRNSGFWMLVVSLIYVFFYFSLSQRAITMTAQAYGTEAVLRALGAAAVGALPILWMMMSMRFNHRVLLGTTFLLLAVSCAMMTMGSGGTNPADQTLGALTILGLAIILAWVWFGSPSFERTLPSVASKGLAPMLVLIGSVSVAGTLALPVAWIGASSKDVDLPSIGNLPASSSSNRVVFRAAFFSKRVPDDPYWRHPNVYMQPTSQYQWIQTHVNTDLIVQPHQINPKIEPSLPAAYEYRRRHFGDATFAGVQLEGAYRSDLDPIKVLDGTGAIARTTAYDDFRYADPARTPGLGLRLAQPSLDALSLVPADARAQGFLNAEFIRAMKEAKSEVERTELVRAFDVKKAMLEKENFLYTRSLMPKATALVEGWKEEGLRGEALVNRALEYFRDNLHYNFDYQHTSPELNGVDHFLFVDQRGVCRHFANAFAFLMRMGGVPTRLVGGYRGGDYDADTQVWTVRARNGHIWTEVWLEGKGWTRIDPTDVVPVEKGIPKSGASWFAKLFSGKEKETGEAWADNFSVADKLDMKDESRLWLITALPWLLAIVLLVALARSIFTRKSQEKVHPIERQWRAMKRMLEKRGHVINPSHGPITMARLIEPSLRPERRGDWLALVGRYESWKFSQAGEDAALARHLRDARRNWKHWIEKAI